MTEKTVKLTEPQRLEQRRQEIMREIEELGEKLTRQSDLKELLESRAAADSALAHLEAAKADILLSRRLSGDKWRAMLEALEAEKLALLPKLAECEARLQDVRKQRESLRKEYGFGLADSPKLVNEERGSRSALSRRRRSLQEIEQGIEELKTKLAG